MGYAKIEVRDPEVVYWQRVSARAWSGVFACFALVLVLAFGGAA